MSVRFFKILSGVIGAHLVIVSLVWVGFSAPFPRPPATFTFQGALPAQDAGSVSEEEWQHANAPDQFVLEHGRASLFNHWIKLRGPSKVSAYGHLGF